MIHTNIFEPVHGFEILLMCSNNCKLNCHYSFNSQFYRPQKLDSWASGWQEIQNLKHGLAPDNRLVHHGIVSCDCMERYAYMSWLLRKFFTLYGTCTFITMCIGAHHLSLSPSICIMFSSGLFQVTCQCHKLEFVNFVWCSRSPLFSWAKPVGGHWSWIRLEIMLYWISMVALLNFTMFGIPVRQ